MQTSAVLSPGRVVDVIDRTFRIYRDNFVAFISLVAIVTVPATLIEYVLQEAQKTTEVYTLGGRSYTVTTTGSRSELVLVQLVFLLLEALIVYGFITCIASENYLGRRPSIGQAFRLLAGRLGSLLVGLIIFGVVFFVSAMAVLIAGMACVVPFLALPVVGYLFLAGYFFIIPVLVLEDVGPVFGLRRAIALGKIRFWSTLGFVLAIWLITTVIQLALGSAAGIVAFSTISDGNLALTILNVVLDIFITPIMPIGLTMMYYNIRIRVEGLDLALQAVDKADPRPSDVYSPDPEQRLLTAKDLGNIVLLTVILVVLVVGLAVLAGLAVNSLVN